MSIIQRTDLIGPDLLLVEVGNALARKKREGQVIHEQALIGLRRVSERVALERPDIATLNRAFEFATAFPHPIYDCLYLALAQTRSAVLVTDDAKLKELADENGLGATVVSLRLVQSLL